MTKQDVGEPRKRRGGRKPGEWKLLKEGEVRPWRESARLSRARLAKLCGVSSTSIQNWETGAVIPSLRSQRKLADLMSQPIAKLPVPPRESSLFDTPGANTDTIDAVGKIVGAYVAGRNDLTPDALVEVIRAVRGALA